MKLIIEIPEGMLDELNTCKFPIQDAYRLCDIIENGTPLPKNHGRLIDADAILLNDTWTIEKYDKQLITVVYAEDIDAAPTIIEADKETEHGKEIQ